MCVQGYRDVEVGKYMDDNDEENDEDGDESVYIINENIGYSEEDPEDDPDVQDIRWF